MAKRLTDISIKQAKARQNGKGELVRTEIPDAGKPGLYLVIQPSGRKSWAVRYRRLEDGKPRKLTLDGFPSLATAHKLAQAALDKAAEGRDPAAEKVQAKRANASAATDDRFDNVVRRFIERYAKPKNRSWKETARLLGLRPDPEDAETLVAIEGGLAEKWGKRRVQDIRKRDILDHLDGIVDRGAGILANRTLAALRKLFNWCVERDILEASPCATIKAPAPARSRDRVLSDDEIGWLWQACEGSGVPFGPLVKLLLLTGQRLNEVGGITDREVNAAARTWIIPGERAKNGEPHAVPLSDAALDVLQAVPRIKGRAGYVFTATGETPVSGFSRAKARFDRLMLEAAHKDAEEHGKDPETVEIPHWTLHDLRRTVASGMARLGIALPVIEKVLNHRSGTFRGIVAVYQRHDFADEKRTALETWSRFVRSLVSEAAADNVVTLQAS